MQNELANGLTISFITAIELRCWPLPEAQHEEIMALLRTMERIDIHDPLFDKVVQLRSKHKIKLPDACIAATAIMLKKLC